MDYLSSGPLDELLTRLRWQPPRRPLRSPVQSAAASDHPHADGDFNRYVKPANLLLNPACDARLAVFGNPSAFDEAAGKTQTRAPIPPPLAPPRPSRRSRARWPLLIALLLGAAIAGSIVAFALTSGGRDLKTQADHTTTFLKTVTATSPTP